MIYGFLFMLRYSIVLLLLSFIVLAVRADNSVQWAWVHYPPISIASGTLINQGIVDVWLKDIQHQALADMTHRNVPMTPGRIWQLMKANEPVCHPAALYDKQRDEFAVYSEPWNLIPEKVVLMHRADAERVFPGQSSVSLAQLFARDDLRLGMVSDKTYYVHLSAWLENSVALSQAMRMSNQQQAYNLYRMLLDDRIDYMIEYPWVGSYYRKLHQERNQNRVEEQATIKKAEEVKSREEIVSLAISELPQFTSVYIACTDNEFGRKVIEQANRWIRLQWPEEKNRQYLASWLDPASLNRYLSAYELYINPIK